MPRCSPSLIAQIYDLLANHCAIQDGGRETFVSKINSLLKATTLDSRQDIYALWRLSWDKPLYQDQNSQVASNLIDRLRAESPCPLDDFRRLPSDPGVLKSLTRYTIKHERLLALASDWPAIYELHVKTAKSIEEEKTRRSLSSIEAASMARELLGVPVKGTKGRKESLFDRIDSVRGYGITTSLHIATDLGYPVYKPDRWLLRFAAVLSSVAEAIEERLAEGVSLSTVSPAYLERHYELVTLAIDALTSEFSAEPAPDELVDLSIGFRQQRFVDLMVAKFGMTPETQYGLEISGKDRLLRDRELAAQYPKLHEIAKEMGGKDKAKGPTQA